MPFPIIAVLWFAGTCVCTGGICYCGKKLHDAYKKGQQTSQQKLALKGKSIEEARKDNEKAREEERKAREQLEEQNRKNEEIKKQLEEAKLKANDPNLSEEERAMWRRKVVVLEEELKSGQNESRNISDYLKKIVSRIKSNNDTITGTVSNLNDRHWIWEFLTLENILIMGACYALYQILKDEKKK